MFGDQKQLRCDGDKMKFGFVAASSYYLLLFNQQLLTQRVNRGEAEVCSNTTQTHTISAFASLLFFNLSHTASKPSCVYEHKHDHHLLQSDVTINASA